MDGMKNDSGMGEQIDTGREVLMSRIMQHLAGIESPDINDLTRAYRKAKSSMEIEAKEAGLQQTRREIRKSLNGIRINPETRVGYMLSGYEAKPHAAKMTGKISRVKCDRRCLTGNMSLSSDPRVSFPNDVSYFGKDATRVPTVDTRQAKRVTHKVIVDTRTEVQKFAVRNHISPDLEA